jgi:hypothetical protein
MPEQLAHELDAAIVIGGELVEEVRSLRLRHMVGHD